MKNKKKSKIIILIAAIVLLVTAITSISVYAWVDRGIDYSDKDYKIVDNMAYKYVPKSKNQRAHYEVVAYGATKAIRKKMTEINIPSEIENVPVTAINVDYNTDETFEWGNGDVYEFYPNVTKISIPNTVTEIGHGAFQGLVNIESITLPENLKVLDDDVFYGLTKLTEMRIPKGVSRIGSYTFFGCKNLKKVVFEGNITSIDDNAFSGCSNLEYITPCNSLTYIGGWAFEDCKNLKYFNLPSTLTAIYGCAFSGSGITSVIIPSKVKLEESQVLDDGSRSLNFKDCKSLKTVIFEDRKGTLEITPSCFEGCTSLETVVLPTSTKKIVISDRAFKNCTKLKNIVNPEDITDVYEAAFAYCKNLKSIKFSSKLDWIGKKAFYGCEKLSSLTFTGNKLPAGSKGKRFEKNTFFKTPENIKFYVKDTKTAKLFKNGLKGSGVKNARIYIPQSSKLAYKNVK